jgi:integrase
MAEARVGLKIYRRHRPECEAGHPEDSRSGAWEENRRGWKRCNCLIHSSGTLAGKFSRRSTGKTTWDEAHAHVSALESARSWDGKVSSPVPEPAPAAPPRITIEEACNVFLATREATVAQPTLRKYKTFTKQLQAFADARGYVMLDQFRPGDMDIFYTKSKLGPRAKAKMLERLRGFFRFAVNREWLVKSPVSSDLKPPTGAHRRVNKAPFTDEQLEDIIQACDRVNDFYGSGKWGNRHGNGTWTGEDLKDFIWLSIYTGLRISDIVLFDIERLHGNEVYLRAKKNGGDVFTHIPDWLRDRLNARAKRHGRRPFLIGGTKRLDTVIDAWRQRLGKVFDMADVGDERATPHRFRHTFARILLQRGVPVADVADLLGDDEKTVREHYARWVPERQARLTKILKEAFGDKTKLMAIPGGRG